jgi:hypothetical protein
MNWHDENIITAPASVAAAPPQSGHPSRGVAAGVVPEPLALARNFVEEEKAAFYFPQHLL